jgi:hypothetical protein
MLKYNILEITGYLYVNKFNVNNIIIYKALEVSARRYHRQRPKQLKVICVTSDYTELLRQLHSELLLLLSLLRWLRKTETSKVT